MDKANNFGLLCIPIRFIEGGVVFLKICYVIRFF